jgi:hypothetical protein
MTERYDIGTEQIEKQDGIMEVVEVGEDCGHRNTSSSAPRNR